MAYKKWAAKGYIAATVAFSSVVLACAPGFLFEEATRIQTEKFICSFSLVACASTSTTNEEKEGWGWPIHLSVNA